MNGLQSLMQGAPTQPTSPTEPIADKARLAAAMDVVTSDAEEQIFDRRTLAALKYKDAVEAMRSADQLLASNVPSPIPPVAARYKMQAEEGIRGLAQRLASGVQQRGQQIQRAQAPQMVGGLPTQPAPNMRFAASGGIIGYQEGGFLNKVKGLDAKLNAAADAAQNERMARGRRLSDYNVLSKPYDAAMNIMYDTGIAGALQKLTGYESQLNKPKEKDPMAEQLKRFMGLQDLYKARKAAGAEQEELRRIEQELRSYSNMVRNIEADAARARAGMAMGGQVKGYQQGDLVEYDYFSDPNLYVPTEVEQPDEAILRFARERMGRDPEAEALAAGQRLRELTGAEDLMKQREEAASKLEAQRASRFSPEMERKRLLRQGLAGLAEKGLGGFGAGYTAEEERIAGEKLSAAEASVADMDKLIGDLRELGLSQFEAEKQARDMVERGVDQGLSSAQAIINSRRQAETARMQNETTRRGQDIQAATSKAVAEIQTSGSQFGRSLGIRIAELRRNNPDLSQTEIEGKALNSLVDDELRAQLARIGVSQDDQNRKVINDSIDAATKMLTTGVTDFTLSPEELQTRIFALAKEIRDDFYGSAAPMPTDREKLVKGTIYATSRGNARWNGTAFELI